MNQQRVNLIACLKFKIYWLNLDFRQLVKIFLTVCVSKCEQFIVTVASLVCLKHLNSFNSTSWCPNKVVHSLWILFYNFHVYLIWSFIDIKFKITIIQSNTFLSMIKVIFNKNDTVGGTKRCTFHICLFSGPYWPEASGLRLPVYYQQSDNAKTHLQKEISLKNALFLSIFQSNLRRKIIYFFIESISYFS